jgi:hypothetical protein
MDSEVESLINSLGRQNAVGSLCAERTKSALKVLLLEEFSALIKPG